MTRILGSMAAILIILGVVAPVSHTAVLADPDDFAGGDGSAGDPYQIVDWNHLNNVRDYLGDHFILMDDLDADSDGYSDLAGPDANEDLGWDPIGGSFTGTFDGRGHEIRGLIVARPKRDFVGLFGCTGAEGFVDAVAVLNTQVTGRYEVGAVVGWNDGTVSNCYSAGSVNGVSAVGGLIGRNSGTVDDCYATGSVSGGGTGKTTEEMQDIATYREQGTTGLTWPWDILPVAAGVTLPYATWNIVDGEGYPLLTFRQVQVEVKTGWNLVSVPGGLAESANTVEEVFGDQIEAIYYWNPDDPASYDVPIVVEPNKGYWVAVTEDKTLILTI